MGKTNSKKCGCCGRTYSPASWATLTFKGYQDAGEEEGRLFWLQLRDCVCLSTLAIEHSAVVSAEAR